jgi:uncharacterized protein (TIGR02996 family)
MANVYDELNRLTKAPVIEALDGKRTSYDVDGEWEPHYHGRPHCDTKGAFGDDELIGGVRSIAYLGMMLPVGTPRRRALVELHRKMEARLANPQLLCYGGFDSDGAPKSEALAVEGIYHYFRPALLRAPADIAFCAQATKPAYPNDSYPWSGLFPAWKVWASAGFRAIVERIGKTPVPEGRWEIDPRVSVPHLVERTRALHDVGEDAATLFLQYLTLADAADAVLAEINDWKPARYKAATAELVAKGLVLEKKLPRATRKCVLPGTWETLRSPNPALESWKLPLYEAKMDGANVLAPLGRLLPLEPVHVLFEKAFARHEAEAPGAKRKRDAAPAAASARDWMREIAANPDDDELFLVYADWLTEHGDPRGEFISLQVNAAKDEKLRAVADALLAKHREAWTEAVHPFVSEVTFERGFVAGITAKPLTFAKKAREIFMACPLLRELVIDAGPVGPVMATQWRALVGCPEFQRITRLDTTTDHYVASQQDLELLLGSVPRLTSLKLGYHRTNEGFGLRGAIAIAECERLSELRHLELPGLQIGIKSLQALLTSKHLAKLDTLRVPYNGIKDAQAKALIAQLRDGLAPALRVLDFENRIECSYLTATVERFAGNSVTDETAEAVAEVLGQRQS